MFYLIVSGVILAVFVIVGVSAEKSRHRNAEQKYVAADSRLRADIVNKVIRIGMSEEQVVDSWGRPSKRAVRQLKTKTKMTLHFGTRKRVFLDDGRVVGWSG